MFLTQYVFVPEEDGVIDLGLPEPRPLISGGEDLHGHVLTLPLPPPHLSVPPLTWGGDRNRHCYPLHTLESLLPVYTGYFLLVTFIIRVPMPL